MTMVSGQALRWRDKIFSSATFGSGCGTENFAAASVTPVRAWFQNRSPGYQWVPDILYVEKNSINNKEKVNLELLKKLNIINKKLAKLKILGTGEIKNKITVEANFFSKSAKDKLEKTGGTAQILKK